MKLVTGTQGIDEFISIRIRFIVSTYAGWKIENEFSFIHQAFKVTFPIIFFSMCNVDH